MAHVFRHPKYYAELKKKLKQDILPRGNMNKQKGTSNDKEEEQAAGDTDQDAS